MMGLHLRKYLIKKLQFSNAMAAYALYNKEVIINGLIPVINQKITAFDTVLYKMKLYKKELTKFTLHIINLEALNLL